MSKQTSILGRTSAIALALAAVSTVSAAWAQDAQAPASAQASEDEEIIITGSHVGHTAFNSPTPVNTIDSERMKDLAIPNVADALNQLPSFRATTTPATQLFRVTGSIGGNSADLRGLGVTRTLVLLDGRRIVPSSDNGTVDMNGIPSALVRRSEVVTGGASAAYGADAVAGVVNLILDTNFDGFRADFNVGQSGHSDAENYFFSAAGGTSFANGRAHIIGGVEYQRQEAEGICPTRDFCNKHTNYVANPGYIGGVSTNGLPATIVMDNVLFVYNPTGILLGARTSGGVTLGQQINNTGATALPNALRGLQWSANGQSLVPFQFGNYLSGQFMQGGDPSAQQNWGWGDVPLLTPTSHASAFTHVDWDITDHMHGFAEFMYSKVEGGPVKSAFLLQAPLGGSTNAININNPFITTAVRNQILAADPTITSLLVNVVKPEGGEQAVSDSDNNIYRALFGLRGDIFNDWNWDIAFEHGETHSRVNVHDTRLKMLDNQATQAITPPGGYTGTIYHTAWGDPVICASSVSNPSDGCEPVDFFGANSITASQIAKYFKDEWQTRTIVQDDLTANLHGTLFNGWAGAIQGAVGLEWRHEEAEGQADALTLAAAFSAPQVTPLPRVSREVTEGYVEINAPLLSNVPLAQSLAVDGAYRWTNYSNAGSAEPWKVGVQYTPVEGVLFRFTKSNDIRAPTAAELNPNTITTNLPLVDPFGGGTHLIATLNGGNPNLGLENAETTTEGVVLQPGFLSGFRVSLDHYDIEVTGAIDSLAAPAILTACFSQNLLCNLITFSGAYKASPAASIYSNFQNLSRLHAEGYELVAQYSINDVLGGNLDLSLNANNVIDLRTIGATGLITKLDDVTGNAGSLTNIAGVPQYKIDGIVSYSRDNWTLTAHGRYIPESILDPTKKGPEDPGYNINLANSVSLNRVSSRFYLDLSGSLRPSATLWGGRMELYGAIYNVFDTEEPPELRLFGNPLQYDPVGRAFRIGLRSNW